MYNRVLHFGTALSHYYGVGRHRYFSKAENETAVRMETQEGFIAKWMWTPWPEIAERKMNVGKTIAQRDVDGGRGSHHTKRAKNGIVELEEERQNVLRHVPVHDLCDDEDDQSNLPVRRVFHAFVGESSPC